MKNKLKQFLCGLAHHKFKDTDTKCQYDSEKDEYTITETCCRCGKKFSFSAPAKKFGL